jgi:hypothetical protein
MAAAWHGPPVFLICARSQRVIEFQAHALDSEALDAWMPVACHQHIRRRNIMIMFY